MIEQKKTICPLDCPDTCGIVATIDNGVITKLQGDKTHPFTRGFLCRKMRHYHQRVQSDSRVLHPYERTGKKGAGEFRKISWDRAWNILTEKLGEIKSRYGGEALLPYSYAGNMGHVNRQSGVPFFHRFGASRLDSTICSSGAQAGWDAHFDPGPSANPENAATSDLIVVWGCNTKITNIHFWPLIHQARNAGGKLVVIDPYRNVTAKAADEHIAPQPGGDSALALGVIKVIIDQRHVNKIVLKEKSMGFDKLANYAVSLSWDELSRHSGLSQERITTFAHSLMSASKTFIRVGNGLARNTSGATSIRSIVCLAAALGLLGNAPGKGILFSSGAFPSRGNLFEDLQPAKKPPRLINMLHLGHALTTLTPPIHGLFVFNSNPLSAAPDASMIREGLKRDDLFTVVHEQVMTPTARYADLLLPATTSFENHDLYTAYGHFYMGRTEPVIPPRGEAISNFELFQTLARKMGYQEPLFQQTVNQRLLAHLNNLEGFPENLHPDDITPGEYIKSINARFIDPQKALQRFRFSRESDDPSTPEIPSLLPLREFHNPSLRSRYPLKLITPPMGDLLNSTFGDLYPGQLGNLLIHPIDARNRRIESEMTVRLKNHRGYTLRKAVVTEDTQPGLLVAEGMYWESQETETTSLNDLTSQETTELGRSSTFHESLVEVERA